MFAINDEHYNKITLKNNTRQISSITINALMNSVHNTYDLWHDRWYDIFFSNF
jgi:hypothetical protein